jgi:Ca2+-binding EF-hand superfamily protein
MDQSQRKNTYLPNELLKILFFSKTKEKSEEESMWLTNTKESSRGVFRCTYSPKKTSILVYPRWPEISDKQTTTVAVEALVVFAANKEELAFLIPHIQRFSAIPIRIVISENDEKELVDLASENKYIFHKKDNEKAEDLRHLIDIRDEEEFEKISSAFNKFDSDGSGLIEQTEMKEIARSLGENPDTDEFKYAMLALDKNNDGNISINEFVLWWKIGRQNTKALPKIYHLKENINQFMSQVVNFPNFVKEIANLKLQDNSFRSTQNISFIGPGAFRWRSQLDLNVVIGGTERQAKAEKFLSQFAKNVTAGAKTAWISVLFNNINQKISPLQETTNTLNSFQDKLVRWCEQNGFEGFAVFVKNLLVFETSTTEKAAILAIRLKLDIEELVRISIENLLYLISNLAQEKGSHEFTMNFKSNQDFYLNGLEGKTVGEFLEICEVGIKNSGFRDRLKLLVVNLNKDAIQNIIALVQFFFVPYNMNLKYNGNVNDFVDETTRSFLSLPLTSIGKSLEFIVKNLGENLFKSTNDISIAVNAFDLFANFKLFCYSFTK